MEINDLDERNSPRVLVKGVLMSSKIVQQLRVCAARLIPKFDSPTHIVGGENQLLRLSSDLYMQAMANLHILPNQNIK